MRSPDVLLMYEPSVEHRTAMSAAAPKAAFAVATCEGTARSLIATADVVLGNRYFLQSLDAASSLQWMQSNSMGMDRLVNGLSSRPEIVLTSARGVYDDEVAEHAIALALALLRGVASARDAQRERRWNRMTVTTLGGRRALVIGWGGVGRGIARRLSAFGVDVQAVRRRDVDEQSGVKVWTADGSWRDELGRTDIVFLALPRTPHTENFIGAAEIAQLPRGSWIVNVGRGGTLDESALTGALESGHLAGAALDVFDREPLEPDSPLWTVPGLLVSPHVGRGPESPPFRWEGLFIENLRRFTSGEPLLNVVDREAGY